MDSPAVTLPKKLSNGHRSFAGSSVYDGVFGAPAKRRSGGSRAVEDDYREIFGGGGGSKSSIPFLDVPELSESKVSVDVRCSKLDYSAIFGGVADSSFSLRFDELSSEPNRRKKSEEQWTPIERFSPPEASENSSCTKDSHVFSPEPSNQAFNGAKKFNMSYNRVGIENSNGACGTTVTTHIAQLNAVQGFAHLIDEVDEVVKPETETVPKGNSSFRASPDVPAETGKQNSGGDVEFRSSPNWFKSNSMDGSVNRGSKGTKICSDEGSAGSCSPPYFGDEVDMNSVAATSAAALRKAIDDAQAKIKVAKEIMERKKAGLGNGTKSFSGSTLRPEANRPKKNKPRELREEVKIPSLASSEVVQEKTERLFQVSSGVVVKERVPCSEIPSREDRMLEETEASEAELFYDVEDTDENWPLTTEAETPHVSVVSKGQNVSGPGRANEDSEVEKIVSGVKESYREADHRQEKAEVVNAAEQFHDEISGTEKTRDSKAKLEEADGTQSEEKSVQSQRDEELSNEGPKPADGSYSQEEIEKRIQLINGTFGTSFDGVSTQDSNVDNKEEEAEQEEKFSTEAVQAFHGTETLERSSMEFVEPAKDGKILGIRGAEDTRRAERELMSWECSGSGKNRDEFWEQDEEREKERDAEDNVLVFVNKARKNKWMERKLDSFHLGQEIARVLLNDVEPEGNEKTHECDSSHNDEETVPEDSDEWAVPTRMMNPKSDVDEGDEDEMKASVEEPTNAENDISSEDGNDDTGKAQEPIVHAETDRTTQMSEVGRRSVDELSEAFSENNDSMKENDVTEENGVQNEEYFPRGSELTEIMKPLEHNSENFSEDKKTTDQPASQLEIVHESSECSEEVASEVEKFEEDKDVKVSEITVNQEDDDETSSECFVDQGLADNEGKMEDSQSPEHGDVELVEEITISPSGEKDYEEAKGSQEVEANESQSAGINKKNDEDASLPVKESTDQAKEIPRRVDTAKERDREIEKGRLAVERAVREARERAFADARERALAEVRERVVAGRAATEARQRVAAEGREKIGKASGEANAKSALAEKASREAKLKVERAAVERATSEARVRALEKAMSSKAASEARKQNPEHKGSSSTSTSRYPSSNHDASNFTKKSNEVNEESAQRCKARLERHQRISERAQKALAEMNRRDLLAQKEQAERNRLAETLDIEVKRWSSGKEGNLRALLSTLQYILGPESGWQPIPLTDVIKSAAVKKAYRKATLFVHPDKLQQRGANIQQKYTCEKVFDLLKEAWNKFNVEER